MHLGPIAYTEAIYDKLRICGDDCGEYVVLSCGVFANQGVSWSWKCPKENTKMNTKMPWAPSDPTCGLDPKWDYVIGNQYGSDPLAHSWGDLYQQFYIYDDYCSDVTFGISKVVDVILGPRLMSDLRN